MFPLKSLTVSVATFPSLVHGNTQVGHDSVPSITRVATAEILRLGIVPGYLSREDIFIARWSQRFRYRLSHLS